MRDRRFIELIHRGSRLNGTVAHIHEGIVLDDGIGDLDQDAAVTLVADDVIAENEFRSMGEEGHTAFAPGVQIGDSFLHRDDEFATFFRRRDYRIGSMPFKSHLVVDGDFVSFLREGHRRGDFAEREGAFLRRPGIEVIPIAVL